MIYSFWDIECDRLKLVIMDQLFPFYLPPENLKYQNLKKIAGDIIILLMCTKSYEVQFLRHGARQNFLSLWAIF